MQAFSQNFDDYYADDEGDSDDDQESVDRMLRDREKYSGFGDKEDESDEG